MRLVVVGAGYVGLVTAACFARAGHAVACLDTDASRIAALQRGEVPIYEPGLEPLLRGGIAAGRLSFGTDAAIAVAGAELVFVAVGTPPLDDGRADLRNVHAAAEAVAAALLGPAVIVLKSTVPVGTADAVEALVRRIAPRADIAVASNPEFLREGRAIGDFTYPDRIVIGAEHAAAGELVAAAYAPLGLPRERFRFVSRRTAELAKYAANAFLATKLSFINEMADLCEATGADVADVAEIMGLDPRIGRDYLRPGPGYGGSCLPKDTAAILRTASHHGTPLRVIEAAASVNAARPFAMARKVIAACGDVRGKTIAVFGLTFAPGTDDLRESAALPIIAALQGGGASIRAFDPAGMPNARALLPQVEFAADPYHAARGAAAAVIVTDWDAFRTLDLTRLRAELAGRVIVDLRNLYDPERMRALGLNYCSIGRATIIASP